MNERIEELAEQAGFDKHHAEHDTRIKQLIELVRQDEREAIAALVEADGRVHEKAPDFVWRQTIAKLIRARGNHGQD